MRNRIITVIFLCFLLFFGVRTGMNVWDSISDREKENQPQTEALSGTDDMKLSGFNRETFDGISNLVTLNLD